MFKALKRALGLAPPESAPPSNRQPVAQSPQPVPGPDDLRLGHAAVQEERYAEAVAHYNRHVTAQPSSVSAYIGLGFASLELGRDADAIDALKKAIALNPKSADGHFMLGRAYLQTGQEQAAEEAWHLTHALGPTLEHLYLDFCLLLFNRGKVSQAKSLMESGVAHFPGNADFKFYLGNVLAESGDPAEATECYRDAVALSPNAPGLLSSYGKSLAQVGDLERALEVLKRALDLAPDNAATFSNYLLCLQYSANFSKAEKFEAAKAFSDRFETPLMDQWGQYSMDPAAHARKLRLGYVSGDLRNHSLASFLEPILAHHDRSKFEVHCYYNHPVFDQVSQRLRAMTDRWVACHGMSDQALADRIRADRIDVLVDLSGHTGYNRLLTFARKPAPVQMTWLGYQATTGLRAMDYRITEESLDPTGFTERFHSERLLRLPASGTFSPSRESPLVNELPALSGQPFTFGCLNNPTKITDEAIAVWARILVQCPGAKLMLGNATPPLVERLSAEFLKHGVSVDRLIFKAKTSLAGYLHLHHELDLALDTFPYNGGTTSFHSLWMGVPPITLDGDSAVSKVGAGLMRGLNLHQFCADTKDQYVAQAVYFFEHQRELNAVRASLRDKFSVVLTQLAIDVTRWLEAAVETSLKDYCTREEAHPVRNGPA